MKRPLSKPRKAVARPKALPTDNFGEVVAMIRHSRGQALKGVNTELIDLYWRIGEYINRKTISDGWGKGTVVELSDYIQNRDPGVCGFSPQNLWRMRQFFEAYRDQSKLSSLLREIPWSSNLHILTKTKSPEEREFYLRMATSQKWQVREVARQIDGALFERTVLKPAKLSTPLRELHPESAQQFKDTYLEPIS